MAKVVAIMSMSLDGFVADRNDGVAEVFDWYFNTIQQCLNAGLLDEIAGTPAVLGNPTVIPGVGVTHLRYPVPRA